MDQQLTSVILKQLEQLSIKLDGLAENHVMLREQVIHTAEEMKQNTEATKDLNELMFHGKAIAKILTAIAAVFAALGASWDWLVAHVKVH